MRTRMIAAAVAGLTLIATGTAVAGTAPAALPKPDLTAYQLVNRFMGAIKADNTAKLSALLAPSFMVQRANGSWSTRSTYIVNLPDIASYDITSAVGRYSDGMLTVRWTVATSEALPGVPVGTMPAPRLSTFVWTDGGWRMTSHANLNLPTT